MENPTAYGKFRILSEIGRGSMGIVYHAHDPDFDRSVALKVLRWDRVSNPDFVKRFLREPKVIGRLRHPNIVEGYALGEDHDTVYLAMEYVEGVPLDEYVRSRNPSMAEWISIVIKVAEALDYAHRQGVVHRDIKPSNILIEKDGNPKITDFGIARIEDPTLTQQTQAGEILGTPAYMSPEQVLGQPVDGRSDIYSLGVILYELACGRRPFTGKALGTILTAIVQEPPPDPKVLAPEIPERLSRIIQKCLSKKPEDRFSSSKELAAALQEVLKELSGPPTDETSLEKKPLSSRRASKKLLGFFAAVLLILVGVFGYYLSRPEGVFVRLVSVPEGAEIIINQEYRGKTPTQLRLLPGEYTLRLQKEGYRTWEGPLNVDAEHAGPVNVRLTPLRGRVIILSTPPGADVTIDGKIKGVTPFETDLPFGTHQVLLTHPEFEAWEEEIHIRDEGPYEITASLGTSQAVLDVSSRPPGARVFLDGTYAGTTPLRKETPPGEHEVRVLLEGFKPWEQRVSAVKGRSHPVHAVLEPLTIPLEIRSTPPGARILIDGEEKGRTPLTVPLPAGRYRLVLEKPGYHSWEGSLKVREKFSKPLNIRLPPVTVFVSVKTEPSGAVLYLDNEPMGTTPLRVRVPVGRHSIRLEKENFEVWEKEIEIPITSQENSLMDLGTIVLSP